MIFDRFWQFSDTFLHLNHRKNDFLGTPQKTRISVKCSENLLFFFPGFGHRQVAILGTKFLRCPVTGCAPFPVLKISTRRCPKPRKKKRKYSENFTEILVFWGVPKRNILRRFKHGKMSENCQKPSFFTIFRMFSFAGFEFS